MRAEGFEPSSSLEHRPLKPACLPVPPHPRFAKHRSEQAWCMSTPEEREEESRKSPRMQYEELLQRESEEPHETAEHLRENPPPEPEQDPTN